MTRSDRPKGRDRGSPTSRSSPQTAGAADTEPLSAAAFRRLVDDVAVELAAAGVSATFASTAGSRQAPGPTWISMASPRGYGRLIRRADGSFESLAYRIPGGEPLRAEVGECVRRAHLQDLIAALRGGDRRGRWQSGEDSGGEA